MRYYNHTERPCGMITRALSAKEREEVKLIEKERKRQELLQAQQNQQQKLNKIKFDERMAVDENSRKKSNNCKIQKYFFSDIVSYKSDTPNKHYIKTFITEDGEFTHTEFSKKYNIHEKSLASRITYMVSAKLNGMQFTIRRDPKDVFYVSHVSGTNYSNLQLSEVKAVTLMSTSNVCRLIASGRPSKTGWKIWRKDK